MQLRVPKADARARYAPLPLTRARLTASADREGVAALRDGDRATFWTSGGAMTGHEWIQVEFDHAVSVGRLRLDVAGGAPRYDPELSLATRRPGGEWAGVRSVSARPSLAEQAAARRPLSQVLLLDARPITGIRILQTGSRDVPWQVGELSLDARDGPS